MSENKTKTKLERNYLNLLYHKTNTKVTRPGKKIGYTEFI